MKRKSLTNRSRVFGVILAVLATAFGISSCRPDFDLDKRMPEWLGTSIYQTLQEGFRNDSTGEFYSFKTFVRLIEDLNQVDILAKTGSKTLFVADDSAFVVFFKKSAIYYIRERIILRIHLKDGDIRLYIRQLRWLHRPAMHRYLSRTMTVSFTVI